MHKTASERRSDPAYFAPQPTRFTRFMRKFLPWQILRFIWINIKMTILILKSHH